MIRTNAVHIRCRLLGLLLLVSPLGWPTNAFSQQPSVTQQPSGDPGARPDVSKIEQWIRDLKSENYSVRETASKRLIRSIDFAIPTIVQVITSDANENTETLLNFVGMVADDPLTPSGELAYQALQKISDERTTLKAVIAQRILENIGVHMRDVALDRLRRVAVSCETRELSVLTKTKRIPNALVIDEDFFGNDQDLMLLKWLNHVEFVKLEGSKINRHVLERVAELPNLNSLQVIEAPIVGADLEVLRDAPDLELLEILYIPVVDTDIDVLTRLPVTGDMQLFGTLLSKEGALSAIDRIENADVFVGRGGFLGVICDPSSLVVADAVRDGPAQKADIRPRDVLKKIQGIPISNFDELRKELAKFAAGETILVEFERPRFSRQASELDFQLRRQLPIEGFDPMAREVVLGRRKSEHFR